MANIQVITVTKPGIISYYGPTFNQPVPVGTKAVYVRVATIGDPYDLVVITDISDGFNKIEFWDFPTGQNPEDYITISQVMQNPDGSFNPGDYSKLPKWLYTNGVVDKLGPGIINPEWWAKNKWWFWLIGGLLVYFGLNNDKKQKNGK